jgi:hypothetical protein
MLLKSPSGETIPAWKYLKNPDRPLGVKERQERIKLALETSGANGSEALQEGNFRWGRAACPKKEGRGSWRIRCCESCQVKVVWKETREM